MKRSSFVKIIFAAMIFISPFTHAEWMTKVDDDVFSGGHKAVMMGSLGNSSSLVIFDCTKGKASIAYAEADKTSNNPDFPADLIIKIDGNDPIKFDAMISRRNDKTIQVGSDDMDKVTQVLKLLKTAKSKFLVGIQTKDGGHQSSFSGGVSGSTNSVNSFASACELSV
ncbi:hypothetical protein FXN80_07195 [Dickeya fangzhongdai]|uniref:hypothetical protein n=1 Tax=Dickeya fangzhongdai TaxID=1778540 RepID=UPI001F147B14|nr:hypothetical protein [Dickeya fangzhongdai]UMB78180.1 hypothetical protein FXN80_07195 [Dickeya fangzhongdai]